MTEKVLGKIEHQVSIGQKQPSKLICNPWERQAILEECEPGQFHVTKEGERFLGLDVVLDPEAELRVE